MSATPTNAQAQKLSWQDLDGKIAREVSQAPKTGGDPSGNWTQVHERVVKYVLRSIVGTPWADHLALITAVLTARRRDVNTVEHILRILHPHFALLFPALKLTSVFGNETRLILTKSEVACCKVEVFCRKHGEYLLKSQRPRKNRAKRYLPDEELEGIYVIKKLLSELRAGNWSSKNSPCRLNA